MSNLLVSYLIEPVVRRARRFSSFSTTDEDPHPRNPPLPNDGTTATDHGHTLPDVTEESLLNRNISASIEEEAVLDTISGLPVVQSPTAEYDGFERQRAHGDSVGAVSIAAPPSSQYSTGSASTSRRSTYRTEDETSYNPSHGIPERFRSTTASFSSSTHTADEVTSDSVEGYIRSPGTNEYEPDRATAGSYGSWLGKGALPADDGMGVMRKRILEVRQMEASNEAKARLIHDLMTERYSSSQTSLHAPRFARPYSPASVGSQERPFTPNSVNSRNAIGPQSPSTPTSMSPPENAPNAYNITPEDLRPTFVPRPVHPVLPTTEDNEKVEDFDQNPETELEERQLGCEHYKRNVKLQCSACSRWYTCRFCHDNVQDHSLNRRETKNMLCMLCGCAQPAGEICVDCGERSAWYYCSVCKLWDDDNEKSIYHCNDCGICRVGQGLGKDFFHCKTCCVCMSISIRDTHRCIERSTDCDCPICGEYMFTSPQTVVFMRCGHSIHHRCYYEHMQTSYRCPICSRSIVNMEMQFRNLERAIESQPMPPQFQDTKAFIGCNDCSAKSFVQYHWLGLKCAVCDSFNTAQIQILSGHDTEESVLHPSEIEPPNPDDANQLSPTAARPASRGRAMRGSIPSRRPTSAASTMETRRFSPYPVHQRAGRSASPTASRTFESVGLRNEDSPSDAEDDDVDFWGGESPSMLPRITQTERGDDEEEEDYDDDDDSLFDCDELDDGTEDDADDYMELFGHR